MNRPPNFITRTIPLILLSVAAATAAGARRTPAAAVAASPATLNQSPLTWVTVEPPGENFSVRMPKQPSREAVEQANMPGLTGTSYSASGGRIYYTVKSIGNAGSGGTPRGRLLNYIAKFKESFLQAAGAGAQMNYSRDVSLGGGIVGQHFRLNARAMRGLARFYATERRIYVLEVSGGDEGDALVTYFLDSFSINEPPERDRDDSPRPIIVSPRRDDSDRRPPLLPPLGSQIGKPFELQFDSDQCECGDGDENTKSQVSADGRLTRSAIICSKGELELTDEAVKHRFNGNVLLRVEMLSTGAVGSIEVMQGQPYGLTEKAIEFARQYQFCPALQENQPVTQITTLTCTFRVRTQIRSAPRRTTPRRRRP
jgi:hypothetical protein